TVSQRHVAAKLADQDAVRSQATLYLGKVLEFHQQEVAATGPDLYDLRALSQGEAQSFTLTQNIADRRLRSLDIRRLQRVKHAVDDRRSQCIRSEDPAQQLYHGGAGDYGAAARACERMRLGQRAQHDEVVIAPAVVAKQGYGRGRLAELRVGFVDDDDGAIGASQAKLLDRRQRNQSAGRVVRRADEHQLRLCGAPFKN